MTDRKAFSFYRSYYEAACLVDSKEEQADFLMAICEYMFNDNILPITGIALAMFKLALPTLEKAKTNSANGAVGGRKKPVRLEANVKQIESDLEANVKQIETKQEAINDNREMINDKEDINIPPHTPPLKKWELQFEEFWKEYPRKVGKGAAKRAFEKVIKTVTLETLVTALRRQKCGSQWTRDNGQYIPHPATWLNQQRWEDEVDGGVGNDKPTGTSKWNLHTDI